MIQVNKITFFSINPYNFFAGIAFLIGFIILSNFLKRDYYIYSKVPKLISVMSFSIILCGITFGYFIEVIKCVNQNNIDAIIYINSCGFVAYGGIIGGLVSGYVYSKHEKIDTEKVMDSLACTFPISHSVARVGCFFSGCCYGIEYDGLFSVKYWDKDFCCLPWQLLEAMLDFILGIIIYRIVEQKKYQGKCVWIYLSVYSVYRFCLEFVRGDEIRGVWGLFSASQYISIGVILFIVIKQQFNNKKSHNYL